MAVVAVMLTSVVIAACGDDDDDDATSAVVGTWVGTEDEDTFTVIVNANGTGTYISVDNHISSGRPADTKTGSFTYVMQGADRGIITSSHVSSYYGLVQEILYFVVQGNLMFIYEDSYNGDLQWVLVKQ